MIGIEFCPIHTPQLSTEVAEVAPGMEKTLETSSHVVYEAWTQPLQSADKCRLPLSD